MAIDLPFSTVTRLTGVDERQVREIFYGMARSADELFPIEAPQILGLDEVHLNKRRGCAVFTDIGRSRIIDITQSRSAETVIATLLGMTNWQAIKVATTDMCDALCNSSPGIDMSAEVSMRLGRLGRRWESRYDGSGRRPHGFETAGGEAIETTVLDPGDEAMAAELGDQA